MKYVCLVYLDPERSPRSDTTDLFDDMQQTGHAACSALLEPAISLTVRAGHLEIEAVPDPSSTCNSAGFVLIEARDLNDAIRLAERIPKDQFERLEIGAVRQLWTPPMCGPDAMSPPETPPESEQGAP